MPGRIGQYSNLGRIGEGTYGVVLKCQHVHTGDLVAVKRFKDCEDDEQVQKTAQREVGVLRSLEHDNIVRLLDTFRLQGKLHLVFEFMHGTVLQELERNPRGMGDAWTRMVMWQLVRATEHLHARQVVHRDIKPENLLLSPAGLLKLCDFGFARPLSHKQANDMSEYVATRWYRAPELLTGDRGYGPAVDVWAIGCLVLEMQTGQPLFPGASDVDQLWVILKSLPQAQLDELRGSAVFQHMRMPEAHERQTLEQRYPLLRPEVLGFLKACLHPVASKRLTCRQLLQLPYFSGAPAWFPPNFFPSGLSVPRQAMSVERERAKSRKQRRREGALNVSPCRDARQLAATGGWAAPGQSPLAVCAAAAQPARQPQLRFGSLPAAACPDTERRRDSSSCAAAAPATPPDEAMADAPPCSPQPPRRSERLQAQPGPAKPRWAANRWRGGEQRASAQFQSPDPRDSRRPEWRQPSLASSPLRQAWQPAAAGSHQLSPSKLGRAADRAAAGQAAGRGQGISRASMDMLQAARPQEAAGQGIAAYYGGGRGGGNENSAGLPAWRTKAPHAQQQAPSPAARWEGADDEAFRSPLRAHAPCFVPQSLQQQGSQPRR